MCDEKTRQDVGLLLFDYQQNDLAITRNLSELRDLARLHVKLGQTMQEGLEGDDPSNLFKRIKLQVNHFELFTRVSSDERTLKFETMSADKLVDLFKELEANMDCSRRLRDRIRNHGFGHFICDR